MSGSQTGATSTTRPLFILTGMRSYSSLISTMLGQHSLMYALPETNLFVGETLGETVDLLAAFRPRSLDGLYRLVAELEFGQQGYDAVGAAHDWVAARPHWTPVVLMNHVADKVAPRVVIEKSPSTAVSRGGLDRALRLFPHACFLHLHRHPVSTCESIARITHDDRRQVLRRMVKDPESVWFEVNRSILAHSQRIDPARFMGLRGEDLLSAPEEFVAQIGRWLGLPTTAEDLAAIRRPEESPFACYGPRNAPYGNDPNFLRNARFTKQPIFLPELSARLSWRGEGEDRLRAETVTLACQLGYGPTGERLSTPDDAAA